MKSKEKNSTSWIITQAILHIFACVILLYSYFNNSSISYYLGYLLPLGIIRYFMPFGIGLIILGILLTLILGTSGKKSKACSLIVILINSLFGLLGIYGIIGGCINYSNSLQNKKTKNTLEPKLEDKQEKSSNKKMNLSELNYKHDSEVLHILMDPNNNEDVELGTEGQPKTKFEQEYVCAYEGKLYCILKPLDKIENVKDDEAIVFVVDENEDAGKHQLKIVEDDVIADKIFDFYYKDLDSHEKAIQNSEAKQIEINSVDPVKEKKSYLITTIVMGVIYAIITIIGILGVTNVLSNILNSMAYKGEALLAGDSLSFSIGMIFFSFIPTIGYFFAFNKMYDINKKYRIIIFLSSLVLSIVMIVVFFITYFKNGHYEIINACDGSAYEQILTICVSHVGLLITYLLTFLKINYEKLNKALSKFRKKASDEPSNTKFLTVILAYLKQFLKWIARIFILLIRGILKLRDRNKPLYYSILTVVFTILCFFTAFIALVILVGIILSLFSLLFFGVLNLAETPTSTYAYEVIEDGYSRTLRYYDYHNGHDRYKDDVGNYWYTDDNGSTFYRES